MRISQNNAHQIALAICQPLLEKREAARKALSSAVKAAYMETIPTTILDLFKKFPSYFETTNTVRIDGNGFSRDSVPFEGSLPAKDGRYPDFHPSTSTAKKLLALQQLMADTNKQYEDLRRETENALLTLRTYKAIADAIPESIPFLPASTSTALTLNLSGLRKQIKAVQAA